MKSRRPIPATLLAVAGLTAVVLASAQAGASTNLDPFARHRPVADVLSPFRSAQAEPEPLPRPAPVPSTPEQAAPARSQESPPAQTGSAPSCKRDDECPVNTICQQGTCQPFEVPFNLLLFRKGGGSVDFIPFYWSHQGNPGHRVLAPIYWHFWSPEAHTRIVAPFYWRVEDNLKQRVVTVVGLYSQTAQPDARSWALWPFFYVSTKFGWAAPLLGSFSVGNPDHGNAVGLVSFLYFWKRSPESKLDVCPLFVSSRSKQSAFTYALPLNFYWRNGKERNLLILPIGFRHSEPNGGYFASLLGYSTVEGANKTGSLLWLYWFGRSKESSYDVGFPLLWSFRSPDSNTTLALPLALHVRRGGWSMGTAALLAWWGRDREKGAHWKLILPFYFDSTSDHEKKAIYLSPLGGYRRDDTAGSRGLTWLAPPILRWRDPGYELDSYALLYWRYRDIPDQSTTTVAGLYYQRNDPNGTTRAVLPFFWYFRDDNAKAAAHTLLPFYFHRQSPDERFTAAGVLPFWFYSRDFAAGGHSAGFVPFAFFGHHGDRSHAVVAPVFWHFADRHSSTTLALPFWYRSSTEQTSHSGVPPLLYFWGHDHESSYRVQFPLFWQFANSREGTTTTVAPLYFRASGRQGASSGVLPLVFWGSVGQRSHFVLFPLVWHFRDQSVDRSTTVIANYLHRTWGAETTDAFFPFLHYRRGARPGGTDETSFTLFPLLHYRRDRQSTVFASPVAMWTRNPERKAGFVLPYFWYRDAQVDVSAVPLLFLDHTFHPTGQRTRMFGPYIMIDRPQETSRILFPLYGRYWKADDTGTYVFPTYFRRRSADGYELDSFLPFFWSSRGRTSRTLVIGPWFHRDSDNEKNHSTGFVPLYVYATSPKRDLLVTPLFGYHRNHETQSSLALAPLYYQSQTPERSFRTVFPLWWQHSEGSKSGALLFPFYWHSADTSQQKSFSLALLLLWAHHGTETTRGILPFWYSRDPANGSASHGIFPLFYERHSPTKTRFLTLLFGFGSSPGSSWWYALTAVRANTPQRSFATLAPLFFYNYNRNTETETRLIPPLLHYSRQSPARSLSTWGLLYWRRTDITSSTTLGLPLYYDLHDYNTSRFTMLLPLFMRHSSAVTGQTYTLAPLFYRRSGPTDSSTVLFPLFWRFHSEERSTTVVFPLYFGFRRPTWEGKFIFPNIWHSRGRGPEEGTSHLWIVPFWESAVKRPGDYMWEVFLGLAGWERIGRNRYLKLFFIPFELEAAPASTTAWYGRTPKTQAVRGARGLSTATW